MWLRARSRTIKGLLKGVLDELTGSTIFTISELGDRDGSQKTITTLTPLRGPGRSSPYSGPAPGSVA